MRFRTFLFVAMLSALSCQRQAKSDLESYLATIRASGMSEGAQTSLRAVASLATKRTLLSFEKDRETGRYGRVYQSATCPLPNATPEQMAEWKRKQIEALDGEIKKYKPLSDFDHSGFVTTEEGNRFRTIYETGVEAASICQREPCSVASLSSGIGMSDAHLLGLLKGYGELQKQAADRGLHGFPQIPQGLIQTGR